MRKLFILSLLILLVPGCAILTELAALTKCEFSFHSAQDPSVCGVDISTKHSFSDFSFMDGQAIAANILQGTLPFTIIANVEVKNPGTATAAVNALEWIAFIDEVQVAQGIVNDRIEVAPAGGRSIIPVSIRTDLFDYLEGDNPRTMINFALNLIDAGNQPTRLSMKIKPSVLIGGQSVYYPGFFTISKEFSSGN
jgi:LEA14-like dessication related protein